MNIIQKCLLFPVWALIAILFAACHSGPYIPQETPTSGTIHISVDESFKPVIDSQIKVFESSFPNARIMVEYKSESACLRDLYEDSTRLIIITRGLNPKEESWFEDSLKARANFGILAYDAVALIVNKKSKDTTMSVADVQALLEGNDKLKREVVMDGVTATSTVRFAMDSILKGKPLGKNVVAAHSSPQVISYVSNHENAVGFIGVSWIGDEEDSTQLGFLKEVKVVAIQCDRCLEKPYTWPNQYNIYYSRYPLVRGLYYILKENFSGVGNNFVNFLEFERGQLIFKRAYLVPAKMNFDIRNVQIQQ